MICEACGKQFSTKSNARRHQKKFHPETVISIKEEESEIISCEHCRVKCKNEKNYRGHIKKAHKNVLLKCNSCDMRFVFKKDILFHIKRKHSELTSSSVFICTLCGLQYLYKRNLSQHMKICHDKNFVAREKYIECPKCQKKFTSTKFMQFHCRKIHKENMKLEHESNNSYVCAECNKKLSTKHTLIHHIQVVHQRPFKKIIHRKNPLICPECSFLCYDKSEIHEHFKTDHNCNVEYESLDFDSEEDFYKWKAETERKIKCTFITRYTKLCKENKTVYFVCNRSGFYNPSGKGKREIRHIGSKKINGYCPAEIQLIFQSDGIQAKYQEVHVGHSSQLLYMNLTKELRNAIIEKVSIGLSPQAILSDLKQPFPDSKDSCDKVHMLTTKDIYNIATRAGVTPRSTRQIGTRKRDKMDVDTWVELNKENVLYYKKRNEIDYDQNSLKKSDFLLIVMSSTGLEMLKTYGETCIVFDSTHHVCSYDFVLTSLMVLTGPDKCHPCCFLFSNRIDEQILIIFLSYVSDKIQFLKTDNLILNNEKMFSDSWNNVFLPPENTFYSAWYVLQDWKSHLSKIDIKGGAEEVSKLKTQIYKFLKFDLLLEKDQLKFQEALSGLFFENTILEHFQSYFEETYVPTCNSWAYCYRVDAGINVDIVVETFHKVLKYYVFRKKVVNQLIDALNNLTQFLYREQMEKVIDEQVDNIAIRLKASRNRHAQSLQGKTDSIEKHLNGWIVPSFKSTDGIYELHFVEKTEIDDCSCKLVCNDCDICIHSYTCTCSDYLLKKNMCKHIHLICAYHNEFIKEEDVEEVEMDVEESIVNEIYEIPVECEETTVTEKENDKNVKNHDSFQKELIKEKATERINKIVEAYINSEKDASLLLDDLSILEVNYQLFKSN